MMKIAVCSDIHLEFGDIKLENTEGADVLILGGDIMVAADIGAPDRYSLIEGGRSRRYKDFIANCANEFPNVMLIMGNHEHYHGDFEDTPVKLRELCEDFENVHFLDKESVHIQDVTFFGGTLWTDMNKEDPETLHGITHMMNDFRCVKNGTKKRKVPLYKKDEEGKYVRNEKTGGYVEEGFKFKDEPAVFSSRDAVIDHKEFLKKLDEELAASTNRFVVCGHHAPSKSSTHPRYAHETLMNGGYSSDLDNFITQRDKIKLWTHGHTHEVFDYTIGECRIVCNPRGYVGHEARANEFTLKFVEI